MYSLIMYVQSWPKRADIIIITGRSNINTLRCLTYRIWNFKRAYLDLRSTWVLGYRITN